MPTFIDLVVCERSSVSDLRSFLTTWRRKKKDQIVGDFMCFLNLYFYALTLLFHGIATSRMFVKNIAPPKKRFYFLFYFLAFQILAPHNAAVSPTKLSHAGSSKLRCLQGHQEPLGPDGLQLQFNSSFIYLFKTNNFKAARTRSRCQGFNIFQN